MQHNKKHCPLKLVLLLAAMLWVLPVEVFAADRVYIAGNPDLKPFEYYNEEEGRYKGVLPILYQQLEQETGIEFRYVENSAQEEQRQLAEGNKAELISAHYLGEAGNLQEEIPLCSFEVDGETHVVAIGFTKTLPAQADEALREKISQIDNMELFKVVLEEFEQQEKNKLLRWGLVAVGVGAAVLLSLLAAWSRDHSLSKKEKKSLLEDPLTKLGNRSFYLQQFPKTVFSGRNAEGMRYHVAFVGADLRRFYSNADEIQCSTASILLQAQQSGEFIARISGGVFAFVFLSDNMKTAEQRIERILKKINAETKSARFRPFRCRAGIYEITDNPISAEQALENARLGWLQAEQKDIDCYRIKDEDMQKYQRRSQLEKALVSAVERNEFQMYLQFIVNAKEETICGAEALSRWKHPQEGILSPLDFISAMVEGDIIDQLDLYMVEQTCQKLSSWVGTDKEKLWISCNITRQTLSREDFLPRFLKIVQKYSFDHSQMILEITEDTLVLNAKTATQNVWACKREGFRIALDDFGSGHSSISDFCDYPADMLKLDREFLKKAQSERGKSILSNVISMAHDLNQQVLCEGINGNEARRTVVDAGCDFIQSYDYARALPQDEAEQFWQDSKKNKQRNRRIVEK